MALLATYCGGGNSGPPPPAQVSVTVSPSSVTVTAGGTEVFTANVAVTWSVAGTGANLGKIASTGPDTALYTAPNSPPTPNMVTVKATSQADSSQSGSASVTITAAPPPIGKNPVTVTAGGTAASVNIAVQPLTPTLQLIALGTGSSGGVTGAQVSRSGASPNLFLVGKGLVAGTSYQISGPNDIQITQPSDFSCRTTDGLPCVILNIAVSPGAALGPRNVMVTNSSGELAVFVGGLLVTP